MDAFKTHGAVSWTELATTDAAAAADFYGRLFGWRIETMDMGGGPYRVVKVGDAAIGGIMASEGEAAATPPMWGSYVTVDDVDATARRCAELGGRVRHGPFDIPTVGRAAVLQDPQGAIVHAITYSAG
jgi:uncharacterized protein